MKRRFACVVVTLGIWCWAAGDGVADKPEPGRVAVGREEAGRLLRAAEAGVAACQIEIDSGARPLEPGLIERRAAWARRTYEAACLVRPERVARVKAAEAYLADVKGIDAMMRSRRGVDPVGGPTAESTYFVALAEFELTRAKED